MLKKIEFIFLVLMLFGAVFISGCTQKEEAPIGAEEEIETSLEKFVEDVVGKALNKQVDAYLARSYQGKDFALEIIHFNASWTRMTSLELVDRISEELERRGIGALPGVNEVKIFDFEDQGRKGDLYFIPICKETCTLRVEFWYPTEREMVAEELEYPIVFEEDFESFGGWKNHGYGVVTSSCELARSGGCSLKFAESKLSGDGSYRLIGREVGRDIMIEGWIYRPAPEDSKNERVCILGFSNSALKGYCFSVDHANKKELTLGSIGIYYFRLSGKGVEELLLVGKPLGSPEGGPIALEDTWYYWRFYIYEDGTLIFEVYSKEKRLLGSVVSFDTSFSAFDRIFVHGAPGYYLDDLKLREMVK